MRFLSFHDTNWWLRFMLPGHFILSENWKNTTRSFYYVNINQVLAQHPIDFSAIKSQTRKWLLSIGFQPWVSSMLCLGDLSRNNSVGGKYNPFAAKLLP